MRTRTVRGLVATSAVAATVVGGVVVGTAFTGPALAAQVTATATDGTAEERGSGLLADRLQAIKDALAGLVGDGTITQEQADTVAETLNESDALRGHGHGRRGLGGGIALDTAAEALGVEPDAVRDALREGQTLADLAGEQGVEVSILVDQLVAAAQERLDTAVEEGRITAERAEEVSATLEERVTTAVEEGFGGRGSGHGRGGHP
jgi:polyhydroxyalkanoate synthesis regulator phasin